MPLSLAEFPWGGEFKGTSEGSNALFLTMVERGYYARAARAAGARRVLGT